jgi:(1->4)-alpha-D-glucan 1-alpha-D-glucosylmutase
MNASPEARGEPFYVPASTYRLQVHAGFPLTAAQAIVPYLERLGIAACYTSPYFTAAPGSTHGYDVCNHNEINPEVGGAEAHGLFTDALESVGMGHIVDFVPNHMGIGTGNAWWLDVLENGPSSPAAHFFDIEWSPVKAELHAKLLLPILGDQYGQVLERGEIQLAFKDGALVARYFDQELPINPRQAPRVYKVAADSLADEIGPENPAVHEFLSIISSLQNMPGYKVQDPTLVAERHREKEVARARLARLVLEAPVVGHHIDAAVREFNGTPGDRASFDALHELLEQQAYRLSYWRTAAHEINYRRFFDINTLAGLKVERSDVFQTTHRLIGQLIADGRVSGLRIDHPDGLFDPARYFQMLRQLASDATGRHDRSLYVVAEKILSGREQLPHRWAVHGTTGYNFLNDLNGIFVDGGQTRRARRAYSKLTGQGDPFDDVLYESKRLIMDTAMASELSVLAHVLDRIAEGNRRSRDFTLESLRDVITEVVACFPVYRTYVDDDGWTPEDRVVLQMAIARARRRNPAMEASLFDFFWEVMLPRDVEADAPPPGLERRGGYPPADAQEAEARRRFAMKLQQYTAPVHAKGLEDTAFYRYNLLLSLNEVGGDPSRFGRSLQDFHEANIRRARDWPYEMLATSTHDTKASEDVRARINVISEIPDDWSREVSKWMRLNRSHRTIVDGDPVPDRVDEYRFYQALAGVWPLEGEAAAAAPAALVERLQEFMIKSVREAKWRTSWVTVNEPYEAAVVRFVERVLGGTGAARFLPSFLAFHRRIAALGVLNSLSQVVLKIGCPGVPDFYQGSELWDFSLVDPDNRRPVDFELRDRLLTEVDAAINSGLNGIDLSAWARDGHLKLLVTAAGLRLRRRLPDLFLRGDYTPLVTESTVRGDCVAFMRTSARDDSPAALFIAPRLCNGIYRAERPLPLGGDAWKTSRVMLPTSLCSRTFRHEITGAEIKPTHANDTCWIFLGQIFETVPVGILTAR